MWVQRGRARSTTGHKARSGQSGCWPVPPAKHGGPGRPYILHAHSAAYCPAPGTAFLRDTWEQEQPTTKMHHSHSCYTYKKNHRSLLFQTICLLQNNCYKSQTHLSSYLKICPTRSSNVSTLFLFPSSFFFSQKNLTSSESLQHHRFPQAARLLTFPRRKGRYPSRPKHRGAAPSL